MPFFEISHERTSASGSYKIFALPVFFILFTPPGIKRNNTKIPIPFTIHYPKYMRFVQHSLRHKKRRPGFSINKIRILQCFNNLRLRNNQSVASQYLKFLPRMPCENNHIAILRQKTWLFKPKTAKNFQKAVF